MNEEKKEQGGNEEEKKEPVEFFQDGGVSNHIESEKASEGARNTLPKDQQTKKLVSIIILLAGLFVGSLFIDVVQAVTGNGFSLKNLGRTEIFESKDKTWVAFNDPIVKVKVITDENCPECDPSETLVFLRRVIPTLSAEKISENSNEGKALMQTFKVKTIPAFIFSKELENTDFYAQAASVLDKQDGQYSLNTAEIGLPAGKYIELPQIADDDFQIGPKDAKVRIIEFSDFQCPFCKAFQPTVEKLLKEYQGKVLYAYKHFPLNFHLQSESASLAAECANEQGKFIDYGDKLFQLQNEWQNTKDTQKFKTYALQLGLNGPQFNKCLDDKKYQSKIDRGKSEGGSFGVSGTPSTFINGQFKNGAVSYEELKKTIDEELAK